MEWAEDLKQTIKKVNFEFKLNEKREINLISVFKMFLDSEKRSTSY